MPHFFLAISAEDPKLRLAEAESQLLRGNYTIGKHCDAAFRNWTQLVTCPIRLFQVRATELEPYHNVWGEGAWVTHEIRLEQELPLTQAFGSEWDRILHYLHHLPRLRAVQIKQLAALPFAQGFLHKLADARITLQRASACKYAEELILRSWWMGSTYRPAPLDELRAHLSAEHGFDHYAPYLLRTLPAALSVYEALSPGQQEQVEIMWKTLGLHEGYTPS